MTSLAQSQDNGDDGGWQRQTYEGSESMPGADGGDKGRLANKPNSEISLTHLQVSVNK